MASQATAENGASPSCAIDSVAQVYESDDELVVLVRLTDGLGLIELRTPRRAVAQPEEAAPRHIPGINADATPC
jgi:hypothetical protein